MTNLHTIIATLLVRNIDYSVYVAWQLM